MTQRELFILECSLLKVYNASPPRLTATAPTITGDGVQTRQKSSKKRKIKNIKKSRSLLSKSSSPPSRRRPGMLRRLPPGVLLQD